MKTFKAIGTREAFREHGRYVNRLYSIISQYGEMTEAEWRGHLGDKFDEAIRFNLVVECDESMEHGDEEDVITEDHPLKVSGVESYNNDGGEIIVITAQNNGATGRIRAERGNRDSCTTDNLDLFDESVCTDMSGAHKVIWKSIPGSPTGQDCGPLPYSVWDYCRENG